MLKKYIIAVVTCIFLVPSINAQVSSGSCPMRTWDSKKIARTLVGVWSSAQALNHCAYIMGSFFRPKDIFRSIFFSPRSHAQYFIGYLQHVCPYAIEASVYAVVAYLCLREYEQQHVDRQASEQAQAESSQPVIS